MYKRFVCLLLCGAMVFGFAGCAGRPTPETTEAVTQPETTAAVTEAVTEAPTEASTEAPTEPAGPLVLDETSLTFTHKGETAELYHGDIDPRLIFWTSGDPNVVWTHQGTVVAVGPGETSVWAEYDGVAVECRIISNVDPDEPLPRIDPAIANAPMKKPPEAGEYPDGITEEMVMEYLDDVIFMGDSTTYSLYSWELQNKQLGDALFLVRGGVSIHSLIDGRRKYFHEAVEKLAEDAVRDAVEKDGKKRLYVMLGLNDVPQFGVERTMELWETFLSHIQAKAPELEIYLQSVTMVRTDSQYENFTNEDFDNYNALMKQYAEDHEHIHYVELAEYFKDYTNGLSPQYSYDKMHASPEGVDVWVRIVKKYIAEEIYNEMQGERK